MLRAGLALSLVALLLGGCGGDDGDDEAVLTIATTVSPITSIVASIAGDRAEVRGIVPEGTNSHTFEPRPSVAELLSTADVIFLNGLKLEEPTLDLAEENARDGARIVQLGDEVLPRDAWIFDGSFPEADGKPNPHLWTEPSLALAYARVVTETLSEIDPEGAASYDERFAELADAVGRLDVAMRTAFATIPPDQLRLLTYHDAYAYFAKRYGFEIIGAIQVSDFEDPSPRALAALIDQIEDEGVRAIFGSEVFPSPVLEQLADETGVEYVDDLRDDDLPGVPGDSAHSLLGLLRFNYATITEALGGDGEAIALLEVPDGDDGAEYPQ